MIKKLVVKDREEVLVVAISGTMFLVICVLSVFIVAGSSSGASKAEKQMMELGQLRVQASTISPP